MSSRSNSVGPTPPTPITTIAPDQLPGRTFSRDYLPLGLMLLLWAWTSLPTFFVAIPVQDECHFFEPVYELVWHGQWRGPHNEYLGHGIEHLSYGHPPFGSIFHIGFLAITGDGYLSVRLAASLVRLIVVFVFAGLSLRRCLSPWAALAAVLLFVFSNYPTSSLVRPDLLSGLLTLCFLLWLAKSNGWVLAAIFWALAGSCHQLALVFCGIGWLAHLLLSLQTESPRKTLASHFLLAVSAVIIFTLSWFAPIAILHGWQAIPDLISGTLYHVRIATTGQLTHKSWANLLLSLLPYFGTAGLICPWILFRYRRMAKLDCVGAAILLGGVAYILLRTTAPAWYFAMLAPVGAFVLARWLDIAVIPRGWVAIASVGVLLIGCLAITHRVSMLNQPLDALLNGNSAYNQLQELVDRHLPPDCRVLTSPQFYHQLKGRAKETRDLEYFGGYGPLEEIDRFDMVFCMNEYNRHDPLSRLPTTEQKSALNTKFDLIYDSGDQAAIRSSLLLSLGQPIPLPRVQIYRKKDSPQ